MICPKSRIGSRLLRPLYKAASLYPGKNGDSTEKIGYPIHIIEPGFDRGRICMGACRRGQETPACSSPSHQGSNGALESAPDSETIARLFCIRIARSSPALNLILELNFLSAGNV